MSWWNRIWGRGAAPKDKKSRKHEPAEWMSPEDPGNPFGFPILNLMSNLKVMSTTEDRALADRSVSWRAGQQDRLSFELEGEQLPCSLKYPCSNPLPDGMLFVPSAMEDKWVIALRGNLIAVARSWTGDTQALAEVSRSPEELEVTRLTLADPCALKSFGDPVQTFDWLLKSHALGARIPLPVSEEGAKLIQEMPLTAFAPFGHRAFCAAVGYPLPPPAKPLRSDGALVAAVTTQDMKCVESLLTQGENVNAQSTCMGYSPLHLAVVKGDVAMVQLLLKLGADPDQEAEEKRGPLPLAMVHEFQREIADALVNAGASLETRDVNGFGPLHAAAEVGSVPAILYLAEKGADVTGQTNKGLTALHITCALGHVDAAKTLVGLGADIHASSDLGTPVEVAQEEKQAAVVEWLNGLNG